MIIMVMLLKIIGKSFNDWFLCGVTNAGIKKTDAGALCTINQTVFFSLSLLNMYLLPQTIPITTLLQIEQEINLCKQLCEGNFFFRNENQALNKRRENLRVCLHDSQHNGIIFEKLTTTLISNNPCGKFKRGLNYLNYLVRNNCTGFQ